MPAPAADCAIDPAASATVPVTSGRGGPNINPVTGLSTDYLNHFTEAIMVLEMLPTMPDCVADFLAWEPKNYREHFAASHFSNRDASSPPMKRPIRSSAGRSTCWPTCMNTLLLATREAICGQSTPTPKSRALAHRAATVLKPIVTRVSALINGTAPGSEQPRQCAASRDRCYVPPVSTAPDARAYPDRPYPRRQRRHHPRRPRAGRAPRARPRARHLDHAGRRGRGRRNADRSAGPRDRGRNRDDGRAGRARRPPRGGGARRRPAGVAPFRHPVLCRALDLGRAEAERGAGRGALAQARGIGAASRPPRAWPRSSPRPSSAWKRLTAALRSCAPRAGAYVVSIDAQTRLDHSPCRSDRGGHARPRDRRRPGAVRRRPDAARRNPRRAAISARRSAAPTRERNGATRCRPCSTPRRQSGDRRNRLVANFNRGYRSFQQTYRTCTPAATVAVRRYLDEGAKISREITARYTN